MGYTSEERERIEKLWKMYYKAKPYTEEEEAELAYDDEKDDWDKIGSCIARKELIKLGLLTSEAEWPAKRTDQ